jgi:hypothetical protein
MRITNVVTLCLGLTLVVFSSFEVARIRHYCSVVKDVQAATKDRIGVLQEGLRRQHVNVTMPVPIGGDLSELDAIATLERGWWVAFGVGVAISAVGTAGFARARRHPASNNTLQTTAATPGS